MKKAGYVYILTNPALPGILKIGKTTRTPQLRAAELSKPTGVPKPFKVAYSLYVLDCHRVEKRAHQRLSQVRVQRREFFELPLEEGIATVDQVGAPYLPTATRARQRLRRIFGDTAGDLVSGLGSIVWYLVCFVFGFLASTAVGFRGLAVKLLLVGALVLWCFHSPPGCLQDIDLSELDRDRSQSRKKCRTANCRMKARKKRSRARRNKSQNAPNKVQTKESRNNEQ